MFPAFYHWLKSIGVALPSQIILPWPILITAPVGLVFLVLILREVLSRKAYLEIRLEQHPPYIFASLQKTYYRVGVKNIGPALAVNVEMHLLDILPRPKTATFRGDFPYRVTKAVAIHALDLQACSINPQQEEFFEVAQSWVTGQPDNKLMVNRIDTKAPLDGWDNYIEIERDERWLLRYRVCAANSEPITFALMMIPRDGTLSVYRDAEL